MTRGATPCPCRGGLGGVAKTCWQLVDVGPFLQSISGYPAGLSLGGEGDGAILQGPVSPQQGGFRVKKKSQKQPTQKTLLVLPLIP